MSKGFSGLFAGLAAPARKKKPDFYVGASGKTALAKHKRWIGKSKRDKLLRSAHHPRLKSAINQLYRKGAFIGDGGTASAVKFERATGLGLGKNGGTHEKKAAEMAIHLRKLINSGGLSNSDKKLAKTLEKALLLALGWKKQ